MLQTCKIKLRGVDDTDKYVPKRTTKKKWKATEEAKDIQSLTTTSSGKVPSITRTTSVVWAAMQEKTDSRIRIKEESNQSENYRVPSTQITQDSESWWRKVEEITLNWEDCKISL